MAPGSPPKSTARLVGSAAALTAVPAGWEAGSVEATCKVLRAGTPAGKEGSIWSMSGRAKGGDRKGGLANQLQSKHGRKTVDQKR